MTIKDLAALSGYAVGTVSRALNNQPNVSPDAREKIMALAKEYGFELNTAAQSLKQTHSNCILAVVRGMHNELFAALVEQLQNLASESPYRLVVETIDELGDEVITALRRVRELKPQGILFLGGCSAHFTQSFSKISIPSVLVTNSAAELGFSNLSSVTTDDTAAAAAAIGYLFDKGHRRIAIIGGDRENSDTCRHRYAGCRAAFAARGMAFDTERYYKTARFDSQGGYTAMKELLEQEEDITAVFAMSDMMAFGAARAVRDTGKSVPADISIVGFDGLPLCEYYYPRMASVHQQSDAIAKVSFQVLLEGIELGAPAKHLFIPYTLQDRSSVQSLKDSAER